MLDDLESDIAEAGLTSVAPIARQLIASLAPHIEYAITITNTRDGEADDVGFRVEEMELREGLSDPYQLNIRVATEQWPLEPAALLGANAKLEIRRAGTVRVITGVVRSVREGAASGGISRVELVIVPAFAIAEQRITSRIFQDQNVKDILEQVLSEALDPFGRTFDTTALARELPRREYTVQYHESDFHFCSRLMEEEGIAYHFQHEGDVELMTLIDRNANYESLETGSGGPLVMIGSAAPFDGSEGLRSFSRRTQLVSTSATTLDFDWSAPGGPIQGQQLSEDEHGRTREEYVATHELVLGDYDSGALRYQVHNADRQAEICRMRHRVESAVCFGEGSVIGMKPGLLFEVAGHEQPELDRRYLITRVIHRKDAPGKRHRYPYANCFECIPADVEFVPARRNIRPRIQSVQTARVCGPAGEEIHTDEYGRIQLHFPWDRDGAMSEAHTCWVRVGQPWAGPGWGHVFLPHVGMEVMVSFLDGNPDRPLVTGCLYNAQNLPPYPLPDEKYKSTIKTVRNNELRFDDQEGSEEIYLHAQRQLREVVEANHSTMVGGDQRQEVRGSQEEQVSGDQSVAVIGSRDITVDGSFTEVIQGGEDRQVSGGSTELIFGDQGIAVNGARSVAVTGGSSHDVGGGETRTISGGFTDTISGGETRSISGGSRVSIDGDQQVNVAGNVSQKIAGVQLSDVAGNQLSIATNYTVQGRSQITLMAPTINLLASGGRHELVPADDGVHLTSRKMIGHSLLLCGYSHSYHGVKCAGGIAKADAWGMKVDISAVKIVNRSTTIQSSSVNALFSAFTIVL